MSSRRSASWGQLSGWRRFDKPLFLAEVGLDDKKEATPNVLHDAVKVRLIRLGATWPKSTKRDWKGGAARGRILNYLATNELAQELQIAYEEKWLPLG
jgi:hypothetical protein